MFKHRINWLHVFTFLLLISYSVFVDAALSMKQAVKKVQSAYPGKVVKTSSVQIKQQTFYRIRVLTKDGRLISLRVNAETGRIRKE